MGIYMDSNNIRNFCILAHIDHGKSTLADRFLEITGTVEKRKMREQFLDMNPLEREKGITIKMQPVRMSYILNSIPYTLNLIDTPGHVDFSYEVSRALAAVEGAILLVDATQGIQAQTFSNLDLAKKENLAIIPVINKIDLPSAEIIKTTEELAKILEIKPEEIFKISAKAGTGVEELLRAVIEKISPPDKASVYRHSDTSKFLRVLVFDSAYDPYQGVIAYIRIFDGSLKKGERLRFMRSGASCEALEVGIFSPERKAINLLGKGEIGYVATGTKEPEKVRVGDTITSYHAPLASLPLPGYKEPQPVVFSSIFPENQDQYELVRDSLQKFKLNDAAFTFEPEEAGVMGRGFRAGFLGMLHMEIVAERLRREYGLKLIFSSPSVVFRVKNKKGNEEVIYSPAKMPEAYEIECIEEPWLKAEIITPPQYLGVLSTLINKHGGKIIKTLVFAEDRLIINFEAPLREIIIDFYDKLKSVSRGFASMSYEVAGYRRGDLARLDILIAGQNFPALAEIITRENSYIIARLRVEKLKDLLPRRLFLQSIQAGVEGRILARETVPALKKDVTGYLYGGDRTRKMKLWKKQQRGKNRLKATAEIDIPSEVFLKMLKR